MGNALERSLLMLSSVEFQNENIVFGSSEEYVVIDELIDDAIYLIGRELLSRRHDGDNQEKFEELQYLLKCRCAEMDGMSNYYVINNSQFWRYVRDLSGDIIFSINKNAPRR